MNNKESVTQLQIEWEIGLEKHRTKQRKVNYILRRGHCIWSKTLYNAYDSMDGESRIPGVMKGTICNRVPYLVLDTI